MTGPSSTSCNQSFGGWKKFCMGGQPQPPNKEIWATTTEGLVGLPRTWLPLPPSLIAKRTCTPIGLHSTLTLLTPNRTFGPVPHLMATALHLSSAESSPKVHDGSSLLPSSSPLVTPSWLTTLANSGPTRVTTPPAPAPYPPFTWSLTRRTTSSSTAPVSRIIGPWPSISVLSLPFSPLSLVGTAWPTFYGLPRPSSTCFPRTSVCPMVSRHPQTRP
jgi:hypothetical protein